MLCKICNKDMDFAFSARILNKYDVSYHLCASCHLIQPENPFWLSESYTTAIAATDVGLISRNLKNSIICNAVLLRLHCEKFNVLDVGGGYGLLCRLLRDKGWNCYSTDQYCQNIFATTFEPPKSFNAKVLLAFEVFEHVIDPVEFVENQIAFYDPDYFVFSTLTHEWRIPPLDWWYYAFETGQHISIYKTETLNGLAKRIGWYYFAISNEMHIFSRRPLDVLSKSLLDRRNYLSSRFYQYYSLVITRRRSLLSKDYQSIKADVIHRQNSSGS